MEIKISKKDKIDISKKLKSFLAEQYSLELGEYISYELLEFIIKELNPHFNQVTRDRLETLLKNIEKDVYSQ
ncbi:DUF2164 family protein (plasmid) [Bacillus albus]|uniref:DUF2164 family protein n=1 Tax=Bacillus cereus group TaxID=86661 RepID=UPI0022E192A3|nr:MULTISPECIES: DUF2164 family protein [Bacillus cereus group]MDA2029987.1 DUF2164 family protein [Bacillus cereus group sp. Bcc03]MDA2263114.1 DUF2164 family protein [Bacillus cereus group sp. Bc200]MDA2324508.1 DUF2164 family protein [Bacillus cereus group sp. Bc177]MDA2716664.1 DUF2164 family protein [Bacillus cereus group sp. Bc025]HDR7720053.1 DUF2164 family protein [Bacillus albus]